MGMNKKGCQVHTIGRKIITIHNNLVCVIGKARLTSAEIRSNMKKDDLKLYHSIQKNTQLAMNALNAVTERVYDKGLSVEMSREFMTFADIHNRALRELTREKEEGYRNSQVQEVLQRSGLQMSTLFDSSTTHVADVLIQENSKGVTDIWRSMKNCENAGKTCMELAEELAGFEEKNMERLKKYL